QAHMAVWRLGGEPRTPPPVTVYQHCPPPTPEDPLLFILVYPKTYPPPVGQGGFFGMVQGKAKQWIHVLLPVLLSGLRHLGRAPARSLTALAQRLGVPPADAVSLVVPSAADTASAEPLAQAPDTTPAPLLTMTAPNGASSAPKTLLNRRTVI